MSFPLSLPSTGPLVTVTHPTSGIWIIELHNDADSRLTTELIEEGLQPALDAVERDWRTGYFAAKNSKDKSGASGALIIVGNREQDKFFSNGLAFEKLVAEPAGFANFFPLVYNPLMRRLLTFPIPTVAAINGHCFAAGMILSLCCDYRVMTDGSKQRAWISMNEIHFGAPLPLSFTAIINTKLPDARLQRKVALEGHRFTPKEALDARIVDYLVKDGTTEAVLVKAQQIAETVKGLPKLGVYGLIRRELYRDLIETTKRDAARADTAVEDAAAKAKFKL